MPKITLTEALRQAHFDALRGDDSVICLGENVGAAGGSFAVTIGLQEEFGSRRVIDTPISEAGWVGMAIGCAMNGLRPIVDMMFSDFMALAMDQIVNQAAHIHYMSGGQVPVPLVLRCPMGAGRSLGAQHSQSLHSWFSHVPGLKVVMPSTPRDAKGLFATAVRDNNPVIFFEHKMQYQEVGFVPEICPPIPFGSASIRREGRDLSIIATSSMVSRCLEAAEAAEAQGIGVEVIDPRTLVPLDVETIAKSVRRTGRAMVVDEGHKSFGVAAGLAARISEETFEDLKHPIRIVGAKDVPIPFAPALEREHIPQVEDINQVIQEVFP